MKADMGLIKTAMMKIIMNARPLNYGPDPEIMEWYDADEEAQNETDLASIRQMLANRVRNGLTYRAGCIMAKEGQDVLNYLAQKQNATKLIDHNTLVPLASLTKLTVATAILVLVDDELIDLHKPISKYIHWDDKMVKVLDMQKGATQVPAQRAITVKDLLTQTSGIVVDSPFAGKRSHAGLQFKTLNELVAFYNAQPLGCQPGTGYFYAGGHNVLGALIEAVSGMALGSFFKSRIFEPLRMVHTGFFTSLSLAEQNGIAPIMMTFSRGKSFETKLIGKAARQKECHLGASGLFGTSADYIKFLIALCNGTLLKEDTLAMALQDHMPESMREFTGPDGVKYSACSLFCPTLTPGLICWNGFFGMTAFAHPESKAVGVAYTVEFCGFKENGLRSFFVMKFELLRLLGLYYADLQGIN